MLLKYLCATGLECRCLSNVCVCVCVSAGGVNNSDGRHKWFACVWRERQPLRTYRILDEMAAVFVLEGISAPFMCVGESVSNT